MPAMSYTPPTPGDPTTESSWGDALNIIFDQIEAAIQQLQIPLGAIEGSDDATAVAGRLPSPAGFRRIVVQADEDTGAVELRDGGGSEIANILLVVDSFGAPIAWIQNAGGLGVNDRLSTFRGLFHPPAWQADIYGYVRRNGHAAFSWPGPAGNMLSHEDAAQEVFEGARSASLGTWQIPFGAGSIALHSEDPLAPAPSGSFSSIRITANTTSLNAVVGLTALGVPVYPATAGEVYSVVGSVRAIDNARDAAWGLQYFESDGTFISQSLGSASETVLDEWSEKNSGGLTAPALTAWAAPILNIPTTVSGEDFDVSTVAMYAGTQTRYGPPFVGSGATGVWGEAAEGDRWYDSGTDTDHVCTTGGIPEVQVWEEREFAGPDISTDDPLPLGTADPGSSGDTADAAHVHPTDGLVTDAELTAALADVTAPPALGAHAWRQGLANRLYGTVNVVAVGSSTTAGLNATTFARRYVDLLGADLHLKYNASTVSGGAFIRGIDSGWTFSGTHSTDAHGLALSSVTLATSATMGRTVNPCTGYDVYYAQGAGAGAFDVSIDGAAAVTVTPNTDGSANRHDGVYSSPTVTSGSHSILITATAATVISGVYARGGDESAGVRVYNSGASGSNSTNWASANQSLFQRFAALSPRLFVVMLGANDFSAATSPATFETNLQTFVDRIVGAVTPTPSILLVGTYARLDVFFPTYEWSEYLDVMRGVAAANPGVVEYLDISAPYPATQEENLASLVIDTADYIHQTDKGHRLMADLLTTSLVAPPPAAITQPAFSPLQVGGLLAHFDAGALSLSDNTAVATWAPSGGVESASLTQGTSGNRPVFRTARVNSSGRPAVVFTAASNHNLDTGAWAGKRSTPLTVISIAKLITGNVGNIYSGRSGVYAYAGNSVSGTLAVGAGAVAEITQSISMGAWHVIVTVYNGASSAIYVDNDTATATGTTTAGSNSALPGLRLGTNSSAGSNWLDGEIAEIGVWNRALSAAEISLLAHWYGARYGITVS